MSWFPVALIFPVYRHSNRYFCSFFILCLPLHFIMAWKEQLCCTFNQLLAIVFTLSYQGYLRHTNDSEKSFCRSSCIWHMEKKSLPNSPTASQDPFTNLLVNCLSVWSSLSAVGEIDRGSMKVAEWQQSMYSHDSGIQSGATSTRDDDGDYTTSKQYTMTTTITSGEPGKTRPKPSNQRF